jgi:hypothetical protein
MINTESTALATRNIWNTIVTRDAMSQANKEPRKQYGKVVCRTCNTTELLVLEQ